MSMKNDLISRQDVLDYIDTMPSELTSDGRRMIRRIRLTEYIRTLPSAEPEQKWIPFTMREVTAEEKEVYPEWDSILDCKLPDDGEEILVSNGKYVWLDTFINDCDGCYLDGGDDVEGLAWQPLPKPWNGTK